MPISSAATESSSAVRWHPRRHQLGSTALGGDCRRLNRKRRSPLGQNHAQFYAEPTAFHDIASGDHKAGMVGFEAGKGWDACASLGSQIGTALRSLFAKE